MNAATTNSERIINKVAELILEYIRDQFPYADIEFPDALQISQDFLTTLDIDM